MDKKSKAVKALKAFTLLEMIIVIAIIIILSSIVVPNVIGRRRTARIQAENDGAYEVYVAAQNYLTRLQKYGHDADGLGLGYLCVDQGEVNLSSQLMYSRTTSNKPTDDKIKEAFNTIFGYEMGHSIDTSGSKPVDTKFKSEKVSCLIEVYVNTYTVRCVYYTDYKTDGANMMCQRIFLNDEISFDNGTAAAPPSEMFGVRGFSSSYETKNANWYSQERVTRKHNTAKSPAYVGQYPIPLYSAS